MAHTCYVCGGNCNCGGHETRNCLDGSLDDVDCDGCGCDRHDGCPCVGDERCWVCDDIDDDPSDGERDKQGYVLMADCLRATSGDDRTFEESLAQIVDGSAACGLGLGLLGSGLRLRQSSGLLNTCGPDLLRASTRTASQGFKFLRPYAAIPPTVASRSRRCCSSILPRRCPQQSAGQRVRPHAVLRPRSSARASGVQSVTSRAAIDSQRQPASHRLPRASRQLSPKSSRSAPSRSRIRPSR